MTNASRLGLASAFFLLAGCATQSSAPVSPTPVAAPAPAPVAPAPAPAAPAIAPAPVAPVQQQSLGPFPPGPNRELAINSCTSCHDGSTFTGQRHTRPEWLSVVQSMNTGVTADDEGKIADYLAASFPRQ